MTGGDATSHVDGDWWRFWFLDRPGGDPSVVGGPPRQAPPRNISIRALGRAHSRPTVALGDWISDGNALSQVVFLAPLHRLHTF